MRISEPNRALVQLVGFGCAAKPFHREGPMVSQVRSRRSHPRRPAVTSFGFAEVAVRQVHISEMLPVIGRAALINQVTELPTQYRIDMGKNRHGRRWSASLPDERDRPDRKFRGDDD